MSGRILKLGRVVPWLALTLAAVSFAFSFGVFGPAEKFALTRGALEGRLIELWTGHLVHFNAAHFRGDWLAFLVWAALVERESRLLLLVIAAVGAPLLSLALLWLCPALDEYRGLSALDCSLPMALLLVRGFGLELGRPKQQHESPPYALAALALGLFVLKCAWELLTGHAVLAPDLGHGVRLLPLSHVLGAVFGTGSVLLLRTRRQWLSRGTKLPLLPTKKSRSAPSLACSTWS